ncbi:hypothetical protein B0H10DRAFT_2311764 [Mycena sp. CBHHK59/15]|nr:hypothetical protein B0H10DRAFT_2311764 [Mycena sp. CBHHK59/15]
MFVRHAVCAYCLDLLSKHSVESIAHFHHNPTVLFPTRLTLSALLCVAPLLALAAPLPTAANTIGNRDLLLENKGVHGADTGRAPEERTLVVGLNIEECESLTSYKVANEVFDRVKSEVRPPIEAILLDTSKSSIWCLTEFHTFLDSKAGEVNTAFLKTAWDDRANKTICKLLLSRGDILMVEMIVGEPVA